MAFRKFRVVRIDTRDARAFEGTANKRPKLVLYQINSDGCRIHPIEQGKTVPGGNGLSPCLGQQCGRIIAHPRISYG